MTLQASEGALIRVDKLEKRYGNFTALGGISFEVPRGQVLGFLGPNGAGKTTTMKILTCYLAASGGGAWVGGHDVAREPLAVRKLMGYLPEDTPIYPDMTALEYLHFAGDIRGLSREEQRRRIGELAEICGLTRVLAKPVGQLSKGLRQRAGLAQALLHDPPILILDEPTSGLDPNQIVEIRELIKAIGRKKTVVLSTHILPEVQATCGRVIIINDGKLVADDTPSKLSAQHQSDVYHLLIDHGRKAADDVLEKLRGIGGIEDVKKSIGEPDALGVVLRGEKGADPRRDIFMCIKENDWVLLEMQRKQVSLEDVFRQLTR
jgi:ABC-2 type transport system ATP-binding protein